MSRFKRAADRRNKLYRELTGYAERGDVCPLTRHFADRYSVSADVIYEDFAALRKAGLIQFERYSRHRIVTITKTGRRTATPVYPFRREDRINYERPKRPVREIIQIAAEVFEVRTADIYGPSRKPHFVRARHAICAVARSQTWQTTIIGRVLARDHSTICHSAKQAEILSGFDDVFAGRLARLSELAAPVGRAMQ